MGNDFMIFTPNSLHRIVRNKALRRLWRDFGQQFDRKNEWIWSISVTRVLPPSFQASILTLADTSPTPSLCSTFSRATYYSDGTSVNWRSPKPVSRAGCQATMTYRYQFLTRQLKIQYIPALKSRFFVREQIYEGLTDFQTKLRARIDRSALCRTLYF